MEDMVVEVVTAAVDMEAAVADSVVVEGDLEAVVVGLEAVALVALVDLEDLVDHLEAAVSEVVALAVSEEVAMAASDHMADTDPLDMVVWDWASCLFLYRSLTPADVPIHMDTVTTTTTTIGITADWRSESIKSNYVFDYVKYIIQITSTFLLQDYYVNVLRN